MLFQKRIERTKLYIYDFITITWSIPHAPGALLVGDDFIRPVVGASALTCLIRYILYLKFTVTNYIAKLFFAWT